MGDNMDKVEERPISVMQMFLRVNGAEAPRLVMNPKGHPYPANLIPLPGCMYDAKDEYDENDAWEQCSKVAKACGEGISYQNDLLKRDAIVDNLSGAHEILNDLMTLMADEAMVGCKSIYALASRIREFLVAAGKCVGADLGE